MEAATLGINKEGAMIHWNWEEKRGIPILSTSVS